MDVNFDYEGHQVYITLRTGKRGKPEWHTYVDSRYVFQVSQSDTAKRLATKFIDVLVDSQFLSRRQGKTTHLTSH